MIIKMNLLDTDGFEQAVIKAAEDMAYQFLIDQPYDTTYQLFLLKEHFIAELKDLLKKYFVNNEECQVEIDLHSGVARICDVNEWKQEGKNVKKSTNNTADRAYI